MNPWDKLAALFGGEEDVPKGIADNVLLAFPPMIEIIRSTFLDVSGLRALDYGCGSGRLAKKIAALGFEVTALDTSSGMIEMARKILPPEIKLVTGSLDVLKGERFDVVAANMVFPFIRKIDLALRGLDQLMKPSGLFVFSVFNPQFVANLVQAGMIFKNFDSADFPRQGLMEYAKGSRIPVYVRRAEEYAGLLMGLGYKKIFESCPPFTEEFLKKYPVPFPVQDPEFLILGVQKK